MEYQKRQIKFKELLEVKGWKIKIYTISKKGDFNHSDIYDNVKKNLPEWLQLENSFESKNEKIGFLILHSGNEGVFSIINWWVGNEMMNTHIFLTKLNEPSSFVKVSGDGLSPCIWELEVINHERISWINHFLKQRSAPNFPAYLKDTYNGEM